MARKKKSASIKRGRREYTDEFKEEAVQMLLDGHTAPSVVERLGISNVNVLYRWKKEQLARSEPEAMNRYLLGGFRFLMHPRQWRRG
jgi:transposase